MRKSQTKFQNLTYLMVLLSQIKLLKIIFVLFYTHNAKLNFNPHLLSNDKEIG